MTKNDMYVFAKKIYQLLPKSFHRYITLIINNRREASGLIVPIIVSSMLMCVFAYGPRAGADARINKLGLEWAEMRVPTEEITVLKFREKYQNFLFFGNTVYIRVVYKINADENAVREYYQRTLERRGWSQKEASNDEMIYEKGGEMRLEIQKLDKDIWLFLFSHA
jgi:hypothetical protein